MKKNLFHKMLPWLCLLILLGTMILLQVFPDRKQEKDGSVILSGSGYRKLAENDRVLYVVESSGNIYTMDWKTGEKEFLFSAGVIRAWIIVKQKTQDFATEVLGFLQNF